MWKKHVQNSKIPGLILSAGAVWTPMSVSDMEVKEQEDSQYKKRQGC